MSNYTKATNFAAKDSLPTGDSNKIVKGTEVDVEFTAIASAIQSKADTNNPTFTGTPLAPTAAAGTNSTQIATTSFVTTAVTNATGSLGTLSTQNSDSVAITGGTMSGVAVTTGTINGVSTSLIGTNSTANKTISTSAPSGGANGDVWYRVSV